MSREERLGRVDYHLREAHEARREIRCGKGHKWPAMKGREPCSACMSFHHLFEAVTALRGLL